MEINIKIDREDGKEEIQKIKAILDILENKNINPGQQKIEQNNNEKKYYCNNPKCKKEITKDVVAYCLQDTNKHRFNGKVYCRECQQKQPGGDA